ncbi:MAG: hypothetical protein OXI17_15800 [Gammaproteobacteria bacterium]|nr:hypothetical protein [Gammaproteobacteria bacterium]
MSNEPTCNWGGHTFTIYSPDTNWNEVPSLYIFAAQQSESVWTALYIGQAKSFAGYLPTHRKWPESVRYGATHVHVLVVNRQEDRDRIERELVSQYQPFLNVQLK